MHQHLLRINFATFFLAATATVAAAQQVSDERSGIKSTISVARTETVAGTRGQHEVALSSFALPLQLEAPGTDDIVVTARGNQLRVQRAEGETLSLYNITGTKVASYRVENDDFTITLSVARGIYIVKVGKVVRRITVA